MNRLAIYLTFLISLILLSACSENVSEPLSSQYKEIEWDDLKPKEEEPAEDPSLQSLELIDERYQDYSAQAPGILGNYGVPPQQDYSGGFVAEMDGQVVRVPGFIVPVEFESESLVSEFFLVPYFGACFHNPPPPPNQTIYVTSKKPIKYQSIYDPVWVMGVINTKQVGNDIATAAYSIDFHHLEPFTY